MKIKELSLYTHALESEKKFYSKTLGFKIVESSQDNFTLKIGWSHLTLKQSKKPYKYHYCFLIPSNMLYEALSWAKQRIEILDIEKGRKIQHFETWNADSFYFYDASGNVTEFIVRYDLKNNIDTPFSIEDVICVNEIGIPTTSIEETNTLMENELKSLFWKGDTKHFGTNGTQEGLFLLPNYKTRTKWFPTNVTVEPSPFKAVIENSGILYNFEFLNEIIEVKKK